MTCRSHLLMIKHSFDMNVIIMIYKDETEQQKKHIKLTKTITF